MTNQEIANLAAGEKQNTSTGTCMRNAKRDAALLACRHKDEEMKRHEQSLLWTVESILDGLCVEGEARAIALQEFKDHLINNFD